MASDLISRKALREAMDNVKELMEEAMCIPSWATAKECIRTVKPVDAVEVVRCKDCRFNVGNMETDPLDATDYSDITCSYFMTDGMEAYDFCSRGEKMKEVKHESINSKSDV